MPCHSAQLLATEPFASPLDTSTCYWKVGCRRRRLPSHPAMTSTAPPPPYAPAQHEGSVTAGRRASFNDLPLSVLHRIMTAFCDPSLGDEEFARRLWAMHRAARAVERRLYQVATSILRGHYLSTYLSLVRRPNSSDPFPPSSSNQDNSGSVFSHNHRETAVFDRFIALRLGTSLRHLESELCEEIGDGEEDLFSRLQPAARLEDLLRMSLPARIISSDNNPARRGTTRTGIALPLPFPLLSVTVTSLKASLYVQRSLPGGARKRELVAEVRRIRGETLEQTLESLQSAMI